MKNLLKDIKINKELKKFKEFKDNYLFTPKEIIEKDGALFCDEICIKES